MKNKKGFTLIELLAVIVILAVIALIAVPVVINIVKKAREGAATSSATNYIKAVETYLLVSELDKKTTELQVGTTYDVVNSNGEVKAINDLVDLKGSKPTEGYIIVGNKNDVAQARLVINGYEIMYDGDKNSYTIEGTTSSGDTSSGSSGSSSSGNTSSGSGTGSFAGDSWSTIIANVKRGNTSAYKVGDTRYIALPYPFAEVYEVRIANNSNYDCSLESKTACGFVIEFVNNITTHKMNSTSTNVGGWRDSAMRAYVNEIIYDALPEVIKNNVITTTVVSGHGKGDSSNFTTEDKLYLLSTAEVWSGGRSYDTTIDATITRQLDYYKNNNTATNSYATTTKSGSWWLRSAYSDDKTNFINVSSSGAPGNSSASNVPGVSPAFRLG